MNKDYAEEIKLQQHQGRVDMAKDASNAMVEYSKMATQGAFLLNGAGAVAIVTAKADLFYTAGIKFAYGAGIAVFMGGMAYLTQWMIYNLWYKSLLSNDAFPNREPLWILAGRISCAVLFVLSLYFFFSGLSIALFALYPKLIMT